jgi:hypothetical protein
VELQNHHELSARVAAVISASQPQHFNPTAMSRQEGRSAVRPLKQLRLHPALEKLGWTGGVNDFNDAARLNDQAVPVPILITTNGTILAGFGRWRWAVLEGRNEISCIEYPLGEDESLQFILAYHQTRYGWNAFVRIRLALALEPNLQLRALDNMRAGGKYKGSANLPEAQHIDVRQEIARINNESRGLRSSDIWISPLLRYATLMQLCSKMLESLVVGHEGKRDG